MASCFTARPVSELIICHVVFSLFSEFLICLLYVNLFADLMTFIKIFV
jgi:hypothetical protein